MKNKPHHSSLRSSDSGVKPIKAWAVALATDDYFIPDFTVSGFAKNILQIHSDKESAKALANELKNDWTVTPVLITPIN